MLAIHTMSPQELHNITTVINALVGIKWSLISIAVLLWGLAVYFLLKEIPIWWHSFDKKKKKPNLSRLEQMQKDLRDAERPRRDS